MLADFVRNEPRPRQAHTSQIPVSREFEWSLMGMQRKVEVKRSGCIMLHLYFGVWRQTCSRIVRFCDKRHFNIRPR